MGLRRGPADAASVASGHVAPLGSRSGRRAGHLGQQQYRRELQRRDHPADLLVRERDLRARVPAVLPVDARAGGGRRRTRRRVQESAGPGARPALLQHSELVSHPRAASRVHPEPLLHGADDGGQGAAARDRCRRDRAVEQARPDRRLAAGGAHGCRVDCQPFDTRAPRSRVLPALERRAAFSRSRVRGAQDRRVGCPLP